MTLDGSSPNLRTEGQFTIDANAGTDISYMDLTGAASITLGTDSQENEGSGIAIKFGIGTTTQYNVVKLENGGNWADADADFQSAQLMLGYALGNDPDVDGVMLQGIVYREQHGFTIGLPLYLSTSAGNFANAAPTGSGDYVRILGYAITDDTIYFDPDKTFIKLT
jgi:hypothetical protein